MKYTEIVSDVQGQKPPIPPDQTRRAMRQADKFLEQELRRQFKRLHNGKIPINGWRSQMKKICAARYDFQLFAEKGGLDPAKANVADAYLRSPGGERKRAERAIKDEGYITDLVRWYQKPGTSPKVVNSNFYDDYAKTVLSDAPLYSENHDEPVRDSRAEEALAWASGEENPVPIY